MQLKTNFSLPRLFAGLTAMAFGMAASMAHAHGEAHHHAGPLRMEQKDWGIAAAANQVKRRITVTMDDKMRFEPDHLEVRQGEKLQIILKNRGTMLHEFVLGTPKVLEEHAALMLKFPNMEHDEPYMVHVPAGKEDSITWNFNRAGEFDFACLIAGHYQAGMRGKIIVSAVQPAKDSHNH